MKKMENLNCMKKTVLKLEKEINAIGNNLSKVKNKDHSAMKKIINNINYLLTKDSRPNNINNIKFEENKNIEEFNLNQCIHTNNTKVDNLISLRQQNNNIELNNNEAFFNIKSYSTPKIYNNNNIYDGYRDKLFNNYINNNYLNHNITTYSNNQILQKGGPLTYSKPRLSNETSKNNFKTNDIALNKINNFNIQNKENINNNISLHNEKKNIRIIKSKIK